MNKSDAPILIVGGGPVGLALALDLGWRGVKTILVEQTDGSVVQPRQDMVGIRTMEFCRRWGIVREVEEAGYPRDVRQDIVYVSAIAGHELARDSRPAMAEEKSPSFSPQKRERCPQNFFDPVLRRAASRYDHVDLRFRTRLVDFSQTEDAVIASLLDLDTGEKYEVSCSYMIGCDGGASFVRKALNVEFDGEPVLANATNVLVTIPDLTEVSGKPPAYRYVILDETGLWAGMVAIDGRQTWRFQIVGSPDAPFLEDRELHRAIRKAVGKDFDYEVKSVLHWRRRELVARQFRIGRVFLAGDAAQQMSPTGAFGMNTGIGEAVDLAWKLEAVLAGWAGESLLESYEVERKPVAIRNVKEAADNFRRIRSVEGVTDVDLQAGESARKRYGESVKETMSREFNSVGVHIGYRYDDSPICWPDGTEAPPWPVTSYEQIARPGARAPHVWLRDGRSTLDLFGRGFTLLSFVDDTSPVDSLFAAAALRKVPLSLVSVDNDEARKLYGTSFALVRPDGHVCWRGNRLDADPIEIIDVIRGTKVGNPDVKSPARRSSSIRQ